MFMQSVTYKVEGLSSAQAADSLKASLRAHPGIDAVHVSAESEEARIAYEPAKTNAGQIADAIEKSGHRVLNPQRWGC